MNRVVTIFCMGMVLMMASLSSRYVSGAPPEASKEGLTSIAEDPNLRLRKLADQMADELYANQVDGERKDRSGDIMHAVLAIENALESGEDTEPFWEALSQRGISVPRSLRAKWISSCHNTSSPPSDLAYAPTSPSELAREIKRWDGFLRAEIGRSSGEVRENLIGHHQRFTISLGLIGLEGWLGRLRPAFSYRFRFFYNDTIGRFMYQIGLMRGFLRDRLSDRYGVFRRTTFRHQVRSKEERYPVTLLFKPKDALSAAFLRSVGFGFLPDELAKLCGEIAADGEKPVIAVELQRKRRIKVDRLEGVDASQPYEQVVKISVNVALGGGKSIEGEAEYVTAATSQAKVLKEPRQWQSILGCSLYKSFSKFNKVQAGRIERAHLSVEQEAERGTVLEVARSETPEAVAVDVGDPAQELTPQELLRNARLALRLTSQFETAIELSDRVSSRDVVKRYLTYEPQLISIFRRLAHDVFKTDKAQIAAIQKMLADGENLESNLVNEVELPRDTSNLYAYAALSSSDRDSQSGFLRRIQARKDILEAAIAMLEAQVELESSPDAVRPLRRSGPDLALDRTYSELEIMGLIEVRGPQKIMLGRKLGEGGLGIVREGTLEDGTKVAVKFARRQSQGAALQGNANEVNRYIEASSLGRAVPVTHVDVSHAPPYAVMPFMEGEDLDTKLKRVGAFSQNDVVRYMRLLMDMVADIHAQGMPHGDLKPANVMETLDGTLVLTDFGGQLPSGIVKTLSHSLGGSIQGGDPKFTQHTMTRLPLEEPMEGDFGFDIYALGIMLHELMTGQMPIGRLLPSERLTDAQRESWDPEMLKKMDTLFGDLFTSREHRIPNMTQVKEAFDAMVRDSLPGAERSVEVTGDGERASEAVATPEEPAAAEGNPASKKARPDLDQVIAELKDRSETPDGPLEKIFDQVVKEVIEEGAVPKDTGLVGDVREDAKKEEAVTGEVPRASQSKDRKDRRSRGRRGGK